MNPEAQAKLCYVLAYVEILYMLGYTKDNTLEYTVVTFQVECKTLNRNYRVSS